MQPGVSTILTHLPDSPTIFISEDVLSRPHDRLQRVGKGAFGEVFKYTEEEKKTSIAVKCLPIHDNALMEVNDIIKEVAVHGAMLHKNIVHYVGCYRGTDNLFIFLEYMDNGSLKDKLCRLEKEQDSGYDNDWKLFNAPLLSCDTIMRYTCDILNGLNFLHSKGIIHRDLRSANILLSSQDVAKIADFGLCNECSSTNSAFPVQHNLGNVFFRAPEMIDTRDQARIGGRAVDIWSLGIMILEMVYHVPPFARERGSECPYMFQLCIKKELPEIPHFLTDEVKNLLGKCLVFEAKRRASTGTLLKEFFDLFEVDVPDPVPVGPKRRHGLSNIWNPGPATLRVRKRGVHHALMVDHATDGMDGLSTKCSREGGALPRVRRAGVCHSPQEMTKMLLF